MTYTEEEKETIENMVKEFSLVEGKAERRNKIGWYSLASSIKDDAKVKQIMQDINAI